MPLIINENDDPCDYEVESIIEELQEFKKTNPSGKSTTRISDKKLIELIEYYKLL
jgi:hypothetical protein